MSAAGGQSLTGLSGPNDGQPESALPFNRRRGLLVALAVAVIGGATIWFATPLGMYRPDGSLGPGWWPSVLAGLLVAGSVAIALVALKRPDPRSGDQVGVHGLAQLGAVIAAIVIYGFAWHVFHFLLVTIAFLSVVMFITGGRGLKALVVFPVFTSVLIYALFGLLLRVPL